MGDVAAIQGASWLKVVTSVSEAPHSWSCKDGAGNDLQTRSLRPLPALGLKVAFGVPGMPAPSVESLAAVSAVCGRLS